MSIEKRNHDDAVSPVVGVMLMLVVTIVIAAVVAAFSTGVIGSTTATPTAIIEAAGSDNGNLVLMHKGGDVLNTNDISILLQDTSDAGIPKEYTTNGVLYKIVDTKTVSTGDTFSLKNIALPASAPANIKIIDKKSGNTITSGTFIMPAGVKSANGDATPTFVVISADNGKSGNEWAYVGSSLTITPGTNKVFYVNALDGGNEKISLPADAFVTVTKSGESDGTKVTYDSDSYGYPFRFDEEGVYTVTATVNGVNAEYNAGPTFNAYGGADVMRSSATAGGIITVTVEASE